MKREFRIAAALVGLLAVGQPGNADEIKRETVRFPTGAASTTIEGSVQGYDTVEYSLGARAGQFMTVDFETSNASAYFNVFPPGPRDEAIFIGSTSGNAYRGTLAMDGDYVLQVYLMRNAARRSETAEFALDVAIAAAAGSAPATDALVAGTKYHATGAVDCTTGSDPAVTSCDFGVVRHGGGNATIDLTFPLGFTRTLEFRKGDVMAQDGSDVDFRKEGDGTIVSVNGNEEFVIPAIVYEGD